MAVMKRRRATPEEVAREGSAPWESDGDDGNPGDDCGGWLVGLDFWPASWAVIASTEIECVGPAVGTRQRRAGEQRGLAR